MTFGTVLASRKTLLMAVQQISAAWPASTPKPTPPDVGHFSNRMTMYGSKYDWSGDITRRRNRFRRLRNALIAAGAAALFACLVTIWYV